MQIIKKMLLGMVIFCNHIFFAMTDQAGNIPQTIIEAAAKSLGQVAEYVPAIQDAAPYAGVAAQFYWVSRDMKSYCFPNNQELARAIEVDEALFAIKTKKELRSCFINNSATNYRNASGRPAACEDLATQLIHCGRKVDVDAMTTIFNQNRK